MIDVRGAEVLGGVNWFIFVQRRPRLRTKIARLKTVAKGKKFLTRIWKSNRAGIR